MITIFPLQVTFTVYSFEREKITFSVTCITDVISLSFFFPFCGFNGNLKRSPAKDTFKTSELKLVAGPSPGSLAGQRVRDNEPALVASKNTAKFQILSTVVNEKCLI